MTDPQPSAARQLLGGFAAKLVDLTDDVLFGWRRAMSAITVAKAGFGTTVGARA